MEILSTLKVILESRTYSINNFQSFGYQKLYQSIAEFLEDSSPSFQLKCPYLQDWVLINDEETLNRYIKHSVSPLVYVVYPDTPCMIRIETYNLAIFGYHANWDQRVHMIAQQIKQISPDILGLQEARYDPFYGLSKSERALVDENEKIRFERHMMTDLMALLPEYPYSYWCDSMHYGDGSIEGISIVSRFPIIDIKSTKLSTSNDDKNQRSCVRGTINHPKKRLFFYDTHVTYGVKGQNTQAAEILQFMDSENDRQTPQILVGDMNLYNRHQSPAHILEGKLNAESLPTKLKDAWSIVKGNENGFTYQSWNPTERLDRIYYRNIEDPFVCEISGYAESPTVWPSDHCTLYADFIISI